MSTVFEPKSKQTKLEAPLAEPRSAERTTGGFWSWLRGAMSSLAVVAMLVGLAAWGYSTDWTLPKFSTLIGQGKTEQVDWCEEHNVPESICVECNKALLAPQKNFGWCPVHGIAQCPLEHPEIAQTKTGRNHAGNDQSRGPGSRRAAAGGKQPQL
jgi:hypothetical protein